MADKVWTSSEALRWTAARFTGEGIDTPRLDAELLLARALGCERVNLYASPQRPLTSEERAAYRSLIERRLAGEPVAYILGTKQFRYLSLHVTADVLIPRPETELLVEAVLEFAPSGGRPKGGEGEESAEGMEDTGNAGAVGSNARAADITVADVGTGSGAVAISIAKELPGCAVYATDTSEAALAVAGKNAEAAGVSQAAGPDEGAESIITFLAGDLLEPLPAELAGRLDVVVSNPPYIRTADIENLPREIRDSEPRAALEGGADGLDVIRGLLPSAREFLRPGGLLAMEIGDSQADEVTTMLAQGYEDVTVRKDLAGLDRVVTATKKAE